MVHYGTCGGGCDSIGGCQKSEVPVNLLKGSLQKCFYVTNKQTNNSMIPMCSSLLVDT